ncbi:MAG TPA: DoxX family protein [Candidatus Dormibacteraeota bacterium]|nr:DoxX family protein [Candidatus Dormibacteraeota bacterium]
MLRYPWLVGEGISEPTQEVFEIVEASGLLILRLVVGLILAGHGAQKLFGWWGGPGVAGWTGVMTRMRMRPPVMWAWVSALGEFGGGLLVALGFLTPVGNFAIVGAMLVAVALVHWPKGFWNTKGGFEFNLTLIGSAIALALIGPGAYSVDALLKVHLPEPAAFLAMAVLTLGGVGVALATRRAPVTEPQPQTAA